MNYPSNQFELLKKGLAVLKENFCEIDFIHPSQLQYLLYQQASEGQRHNALFISPTGEIVKGHKIEGDKAGFTPLIDFLNEDNFPLYPSQCNDNHIETAVKKALSLI